MIASVLILATLVWPHQAAPKTLEELIRALASNDWPTVLAAKEELESRQGEAIQLLLDMMDRDERVPLADTADLIYPGAREFWGHGYIVDYDIDWLPVRAGWVLEDLTFRRFGFREGAITEAELLKATKEGKRDVPLNEVVKIAKEPEVRKKARAESVKQAKAWWQKSSKSWTRFGALKEALSGDDADVITDVIDWMWYGRTLCDALTKESYERELLPLIRQQVESRNEEVRRQATLVLKNFGAYWECHGTDAFQRGRSSAR